MQRILFILFILVLSACTLEEQAISPVDSVQVEEDVPVDVQFPTTLEEEEPIVADAVAPEIEDAIADSLVPENAEESSWCPNGEVDSDEDIIRSYRGPIAENIGGIVHQVCEVTGTEAGAILYVTFYNEAETHSKTVFYDGDENADSISEDWFEDGKTCTALFDSSGAVLVAKDCV